MKKEITDKKLAKHCQAIVDNFKDYKTCKEINVDCGQCKITIMVGYLWWMLDILGYSSGYPQKDKKPLKKGKGVV